MDSDGDPDIIGAAQEDADISWWDVTCCVGSSELVSSILDIQASVDWDSLTLDFRRALPEHQYISK